MNTASGQEVTAHLTGSDYAAILAKKILAGELPYIKSETYENFIPLPTVEHMETKYWSHYVQ